MRTYYVNRDGLWFRGHAKSKAEFAELYSFSVKEVITEGEMEKAYPTARDAKAIFSKLIKLD